MHTWPNATFPQNTYRSLLSKAYKFALVNFLVTDPFSKMQIVPMQKLAFQYVQAIKSNFWLTDRKPPMTVWKS